MKVKNKKARYTESARGIAIEQLMRLDARTHNFETDTVLPIRAERDHRLIREYVQGIMRQKRWLDFIIEYHYRGSFETMELHLQWILRLGVYDLLLMRTPAHAAINEAVELAKTRIRDGAGKLANGILRTIDRKRNELPQPDNLPLVKRLGIQYSHPDWLVKRWLNRFGEEVEQLLAWNNERPVYALRINTSKISPGEFKKKLTEEKVDWEDGAFLDDFVRVHQLQPVVRGGFLQNGLCAVQDESAGLVVRLLDPKPGEFVVDACAAPGGKTLYCAALMEGEGELLALDVQSDRLDKLRNVQNAYEADWVSLAAFDIRTAKIKDPVDKLLLDVPCTGLGVLAKRADLRWKRTEEDLDSIKAIQAGLLESASEWVKPGGVMVYSTCTIAPEENEEQIDSFLQSRTDFELEPADLPGSVVSAEGFLYTLPHKHKVDGAFAARLRRKG